MVDKISLSVVMPVYNGERFIERALDCVFAQSELPTEVIIVDDGSKDDTLHVIQTYMDRNKTAEETIRLITQTNQGAGAARNQALANSTCDWIAFFDSDDLWDSRKLELIYKAIRSNPEIGIITHDEYEAREENLEKKEYIPRHKGLNPTEDLFVQLYRGNLFSTSCMVVKREVIQKAGGFDRSLLSAQDYDLWIRCGRYTKAVYLEEPLATYIIRNGNITSNTYRRYQCEIRICRKYSEEILQKMGAKAGKKIIRKRLLQIHKVEAYLSLKNKQIVSFFKISLSLPGEWLRG